ncbi:MAG: hypothetical protein PUB11_00285 [Oscillospiraceae bacterium]|nr:hypothetical protein [Oscillospiraceae bacterium]
MSEKWIVRIKVLLLSAVFSSIGNWINTRKADVPVNPLMAAPGLIAMFLCIVAGCLIQDFIEGKFKKFHLPTILYISMITIILSIPGVPTADFIASSFAKIGLLPLCTPILGYAGLSIAKDLDDFKKQGFAIVVVALCTFAGTFLGSAIIAQIVLKMTGVI